MRKAVTGWKWVLAGWMIGFIMVRVGVAADPVPAAPSEVVVDRFSKGADPEGLPVGWEALTFKKVPRHTVYTVEEIDQNFCLKADSRDSASGLIRQIELDPNDYPILSWRWRVERAIQKGDETRKDRDDYAARIYVTFRYDPETAGFLEKIRFGGYKALYGDYPPKASLNYVWANRLAKGESVPSPYTDRSRMIAVQSGPAGVGEWHSEERNLLEDYRNFFGEDPPLIQGIAIMTDTDNTGETAVAYYDDIVFRSSPSLP